ncbi:MAG TPA: lysylphosphatidylglycerol synthase transmembrane domain-containing protein [Terriglobales bacterium]|nr:lysylphosphatidylglycerol synthase transmembrane domain-containing protein [Terriglobales bacterium]
MKKRRILIPAVTLAILVGLAYLEFRTWKRFDWAVFREQLGQVRVLPVLSAVALIWVVYYLRALRWRTLLPPSVRASAWALTPPTVIGFTGLALFGRPGELIRPYLIARRQNLTFSSQLAVWAVERIFDTAAVVVMLALTLFVFPRQLHAMPYFHSLHPGALRRMRWGGILLMLLTGGLALGAAALLRHSSSVAAWVERTLGRLSPALGRHAAGRVRAFGEGLNTLHSVADFLLVSGLSLLIWLCVAGSYLQVTHAFSESQILQSLTLTQVLLLMGASMVGAVLQLPAVGGGSQLAVITMLKGVFGVRPELAVSCGILLWLVTFWSITPVGLILARYEHLSLSRLKQEGEEQEEGAG